MDRRIDTVGCRNDTIGVRPRRLALLVLTLAATVALSGAEPAKVAGKWNASMQLEAITGHPVLTFKQDGEKLTGTYEGRYGETPLEGQIKDDKIQFTVTFTAEGQQTRGVFLGTVKGDEMGGDVSFEGAGDGTWSATRIKP
jgi:hypothetical protein